MLLKMKYGPKRPPFHTEAIGTDKVFLLDALFVHLFVGPLKGNAVVARESLHPSLVLVGSLGQNLFGDGVGALHVAERSIRSPPRSRVGNSLA
jgi:hypothetical protein